MDEVIDYPRYFTTNNPLTETAAKELASKVEQWKLVEFERTPAGCPISKEGEVWDPVIGAGPFRPYMAPKGVAVADGVLVMMRFYYELPTSVSGITLADLQKIHGFTQRGRIQRRVTKTPRDNGSTVYDADGNLMTIDETVMRGNKTSDALRFPGPFNETNFLEQHGSDKQVWFNRLFNGADTPLPLEGAAFAQHWLTNYGCDIPRRSEFLGQNVRRVDEAKQERYKQYYSTALGRRGKRTESTSEPKPKPAPSIKLRLNLNTAQNPKPKPLEAPAVLIEPNEDKDREESEESEEEIPIARKRRKLISRPEIFARVNNLVAASFRDPSRDQNNKEGGNEEVASALTKTAAEAAIEKSAETLENSALTSLNNTILAPAETSAEIAARLGREIAEKSKALEDLQRKEAEASKQAIAEAKAEAEKAAEERAAAEKAAAEKADAEKAAAGEAAAKLVKASTESNRKSANKSLKYNSEIIKYAISAYFSQRKADAADKTLVRKLDKELASYFGGAFKVTASESQKRKFKEDESDDERPVKVAKN